MAGVFLRILPVGVGLGWAVAALLFGLLMRMRILMWGAVLPEALARSVLPGVTLGLMVSAVALGLFSGLLWRGLEFKWALGIGVMVPVMLVSGSLAFGRLDTQGLETQVLVSIAEGDVQGAREGLLRGAIVYQLPAEFEALLRVGTDINARDPWQRSALYWAARNGAWVERLLQAGAKPDENALMQAAFWGRVDSTEALLAAVEVEGQSVSREILEMALRNARCVRSSGEQDRERLAQLLIERGAIDDPNICFAQPEGL